MARPVRTGCYLAKETSPLRANDEVDQAAHRVVVGKRSAYDLYLTRTRQQAQIVRSLTSPTVVDTFLAIAAGPAISAAVAARP